MKQFTLKSICIAILCFCSTQLQAQDGYTYSLVDNGSFNYTITAVPNASTNSFATSVQSYGFTILLPDGITATITSSLGSSAGANFFNGSDVGQAGIDGYLITETLGSPIALTAPSSGTPTAMVTIQLDQSPTSGSISILENNSALATTVTPLKSFMSADMVDDSMAVFPNVVDANASGTSGTSSFIFATLSTPDEITIDFSIYPNPTTDKLYINLTQDLEKVEVINMNGQLVLSKENNLKAIDVSRLQNGAYFLKVYAQNGSTAKKFIKN
ncbi:MAG: T9SS type A sorting domain-containing protein [Bacteroidota bacterium]